MTEKRGKSKPERDRMSSPQNIPRRKAETSHEEDSTGSAAASSGSKICGKTRKKQGGAAVWRESVQCEEMGEAV